MISKQTRKALGYFFTVLLIVLGSIILVAMAQGYRYDFLTGQIHETGLVLIDSRPSGADIYLNGKHTKYRSAHRLADAQVGKLTIEQVLTGYRVWRKSLIVRAQEVSFADYAILLPQKLTYTSFLAEYKVSQLVQTPDQHKSVMVTTKPQAGIWTLDNNNTPTKLYEVPAESADPSITELQLSDDGNSLLFRQNINGLSSIMAIIGSAQAIDLTQLLQINSGALVFNPDNSHELFWTSSDGNLRKVNLDTKTLGPVIAANVSSFSTKKGHVYFITKPDQTEPTPVLWTADTSGQNKKLLVKNIPSSSSYQIDYSKSRSDSYVAILPNDTKQLIIIKNPSSQKPVSSVLSSNTSSFLFSKDGSFIAYNSSGQMKTYDFEQAQRFNAGTKLGIVQAWQWYDPEHILVIANNQLRLIDYDGQNDQIINDTTDAVGFAAIHTDAHSIIYTSQGSLRSVSLTENSF